MSGVAWTTTTMPELPQEIIDHIVSRISDRDTLKARSLVYSQWSAHASGTLFRGSEPLARPRSSGIVGAILTRQRSASDQLYPHHNTLNRTAAPAIDAFRRHFSSPVLSRTLGVGYSGMDTPMIQTPLTLHFRSSPQKCDPFYIGVYLCPSINLRDVRRSPPAFQSPFFSTIPSPMTLEENGELHRGLSLSAGSSTRGV